MRAPSREKLTTPDLVLLSLLAEKAMHGYEANATLEARNVRDWAGVSRPQVYYSLDKLAELGMLETSHGEPEKPLGPERRVFATTKSGRAALASALERDEWAKQIDRPPFLTWLALSWQCRRGVFRKQLKNRRKFLENVLSCRRATLKDVVAEVGHPFHEAVWMLNLAIGEIETELAWLDKVKRELPKRASAKEASPGVTG
jgi:DNA-binding PadR family transcriptional regulator